jgi:hypothetical protein
MAAGLLVAALLSFSFLLFFVALLLDSLSLSYFVLHS